MNAFEQVKSLTMISKVEAIVYLFRTQFPESLVDLKPWIKDNKTKEFSDPNSIDISFNFPDSSLSCRCRSVLMQIKIYQDGEQQNYQATGIDLSGFKAYQEQWRFSTVGNWDFFGTSRPSPGAQKLLRRVCDQVLQLFDNSFEAV
jgi:hypothetical protein